MDKPIIEHQDCPENNNSSEKCKKLIREFTFDDEVIVGELIAEKNSKKSHVSLYQLPLCDHINFTGTPIVEIQKEFPGTKFNAGELINYTYLMFRDEKAVLEYD